MQSTDPTPMLRGTDLAPFLRSSVPVKDRPICKLCVNALVSDREDGGLIVQYSLTKKAVVHVKNRLGAGQGPCALPGFSLIGA